MYRFSAVAARMLNDDQPVPSTIRAAGRPSRAGIRRAPTEGTSEAAATMPQGLRQDSSSPSARCGCALRPVQCRKTRTVRAGVRTDRAQRTRCRPCAPAHRAAGSRPRAGALSPPAAGRGAAPIVVSRAAPELENRQFSRRSCVLVWHPLPVSPGDTRPSVVTAVDAVSLLSDVVGTEYVLVGPLAGGETGATAVDSAAGQRYVLKWELDLDNQDRRREGVDLADRLREEARWPAPRQQVIEAGECLFVLQEFLPGATVNHLSHELVDTLFEMHERRLDMASDQKPNRWADDMIEILVAGGNGYCLHEPLRTFNPRTRRVVERIEEIGRSTKPADLQADNVVHGDLHPGNLLQTEGRLSAVVDMDYTRLGDADFDLTMLALTSLGVAVEPGVRTRLYERGLQQLPEPRQRAYVGNLLLRFLDWPIRKNRPTEIEFWLAEADRLLPT